MYMISRTFVRPGNRPLPTLSRVRGHGAFTILSHTLPISTQASHHFVTFCIPQALPSFSRSTPTSAPLPQAFSPTFASASSTDAPGSAWDRLTLNVPLAILLTMEPYWEKQGLSIYCGDCLEVIPQLDVEFDLGVTSPPYALGKEYESGLEWNGLLLLISMVGAVSIPKFRPGAFFVVNFGETSKYWRTMAELYNRAFRMTGWVMHSRRIWKKKFSTITLGPSGINLSVPAAEWEYIWTFRKPPNSKEVFRDRKLTRRGVWDSSEGDTAGKDHPAAFPVWLPSTVLRAWSDPGNMVLDPFLGSGTTLVACYRMGRRCIGIERDEQYCKMAALRIEHEMGGW